MRPFHLFLPARQLRRQRGTAILQFVGENWKAGYAAVDPENAGEFQHFDDLVRTGAVEKCCLHMMLQRLAVEIGACSVRRNRHQRFNLRRERLALSGCREVDEMHGKIQNMRYQYVERCRSEEHTSAL